MKPGGGRSKGAAWERQCAIQLRAVYPNAKRGLQGRGGGEAPDVDGCDDFWLECKAGAPAKKPVEALEQAERDAKKAGDKRTCVALCKQDRKEPTATMRLSRLTKDWGDAEIVVTMSFEDFIKLARRF
jgi:hypothetical protein